MAKVKNVEDLLAEQAVRKAVSCYSRGADRCDVEIMKSAFHGDAEVRYGSFDGHYAEFCETIVEGNLALNDTTHTVVNQYFDIDAASGKGVGEVYVLAFFSLTPAGDIVPVGEDKEGQSDGGQEYLVSGRYIDTYECRDDDWRITFRQYVIDWSRTTEYTGHDPNQMFESLIYRGTQNAEDLSYAVLNK